MSISITKNIEIQEFAATSFEIQFIIDDFETWELQKLLLKPWLSPIILRIVATTSTATQYFLLVLSGPENCSSMTFKTYNFPLRFLFYWF